MTDAIVRIVVIVALIALSLFRLIRYFRHGVAKRVTAVPASAGMLLTETPRDTPAVAPLAPNAPRLRSGRFMAGLITLVVWMGANLVLSAVLFGLPGLSGIPAIWRLFVLIFANFYLFPFAQRVGEKRYKPQQAESAENANPFGN